MNPGKTKPALKNINNRLTENQITFITVTFIILTGFAVYANSMNSKLVYDDQILIKDNIYIKSWSYLPKIFTEDIGSGGGRKNKFYRPLQTLTYLIDYSLWKLDIRGYHLTNTGLHILAGLVIYWLINILYQDKTLSLFTSLIFVIHPIHTEAVAYISGRADSLSAVFILLGLIFYIKQSHFKRLSFHILMILSYILALLSREYSLILPVAILLYHCCFRKKFAIKEFLSLSGITFIYILLRITILKSILPDHASFPTTILQRMPGFLAAITDYIRLMILPFDLHMEYGKKLFRFSDPKVISGALILVSFLTCGFWRRDRSRLVFFAITWFFVTLLPVSNLYPINAYMAEHWLYIPSIGFFLILANCLYWLYRNKNLRIFAAAFMVSLVFFYSYLTIRQNNYWRDPIAFYERTLSYSPDSPRLYDSLGIEYRAIGDYRKAIALYKKAIALRPGYVNAYNNLGIAYRAIGREKEAVASYKKAIEIDPDCASAYSNIGVVYAATGREEDAIPLFKKAVELYPYFANAYYNLGIAYRAIGREKEAVASYKKAIEIDPDCASAYIGLGIIYASTGRNKDAIEMYKKAIETRPDFAYAYYNLAVTYRDMGQDKKAKQLFRRAAELDPSF